MDDNLSKALIMAGGILLSILLVAFLNLSLNKMGYIASSEDEATLTEQASIFNKEYEVYDKDLMYGADVISCLCKAYDNNRKINNEYGEKIDSSYEIQVSFKINTALEESIEVYHISKTTQKEQPYTEGYGPTAINLNSAKFNFINKNGIETEYKGTDNLKTTSQLLSEINPNTLYTLNASSITEEDSVVSKLINTASFMSETVKNTDAISSGNPDSWSKAIFKSILYDLKTRKFKCSQFEYNDKTGRVYKISFEEI